MQISFQITLDDSRTMIDLPWGLIAGHRPFILLSIPMPPLSPADRPDHTLQSKNEWHDLEADVDPSNLPRWAR